MTFKDQSWADRRKHMGDQAEAAFEELYDRQWVRYGLNRPDRHGFRVGKLDRMIQYTPDYLCDDHFVEVQGFGQDQTLKIKLEKWAALERWHAIMPVRIFAWDSYNQRAFHFPLPHILSLLGNKAARIDTFPEGDPYFALPIEELLIESS